MPPTFIILLRTKASKAADLLTRNVPRSITFRACRSARIWIWNLKINSFGHTRFPPQTETMLCIHEVTCCVCLLLCFLDVYFTLPIVMLYFREGRTCQTRCWSFANSISKVYLNNIKPIKLSFLFRTLYDILQLLIQLWKLLLNECVHPN